jgi:hypothetical protein
MAAFADLAACETRVKAKIVDKTWVNGHAGRTQAGVLCVRVQRPMSPTNPGYGAWVEITDDATV